MACVTSGRCGVLCLHCRKFVAQPGIVTFLAQVVIQVKSIAHRIVYSQLLTLDEKDPKRLFEGNALIRRLVRVGVLDESRMKLDYVLALKVEDFLERRLQTCVYKLGLAKSIHHARVLIRQRHIRYVLHLSSAHDEKLSRES